MCAMPSAHRRLLWHGMFLFLLGLVTGFAEPHFVNMRMGLAAHLEGVLNGIFLLVLGAAWTEVRLSPEAKAAAFWTALYGSYLNWLLTTFAAVFGTGALSPITAPGRTALPWQERAVPIGFLSVGIATVLCSLLVLWGLRRKP
jgi:hydroxylaminobenzene mutase